MSVKRLLELVELKEGVTQEQVEEVLNEGSITQEQVEQYLETDEGKRFLQPKLDKNFSKGLDTWKQNNFEKELEKRVSQKVSELYPDEDPNTKKFKELERKIEEAEKKRMRSEMRALALSEASKKGLPTSLVDLVVTDDETTTTENLERVSKSFKEAVQEAVKGKFRDGGREIEPGDKSPTDIGGLSMEEYVAQREKQGVKS